MNHDKPMNISDEQLSAFLDAELPEADMEMIREQLVEDEELANRLADLAVVDEIVATAYAHIDSRPLPDSVTNLLVENTPERAQVIQFPLLKKMQKNIQTYIAVAASLTLVIGFGISQMVTNENTEWESIAQVLEHTASGIEVASTTNTHIKARATFIDKDGNFCRQFSIQNKKGASENIACRQDDRWQLTASADVAKTEQSNNYQTATGGSTLDEKIEDIAKSDFFDAQAEAEAISQHWSIKK